MEFKECFALVRLVETTPPPLEELVYELLAMARA